MPISSVQSRVFTFQPTQRADAVEALHLEELPVFHHCDAQQGCFGDVFNLDCGGPTPVLEALNLVFSFLRSQIPDEPAVWRCESFGGSRVGHVDNVGLGDV